jgi:hypothetical protein
MEIFNRSKFNLAIVVLFVITTLLSYSATHKTLDLQLEKKWVIDKWGFNAIDQSLTTCDKQGYIQFNSDGTFERKDYYFDGSSCILEGFDIGIYTYDKTLGNITLNFNDPVEGAQIEILNNIIITETSLNYSWDENRDGIDEHNLYFISSTNLGTQKNSLNNKISNPIRAFDLLGKKVSTETNNQIIIIEFENGKTKKIYNQKK